MLGTWRFKGLGLPVCVWDTHWAGQTCPSTLSQRTDLTGRQMRRREGRLHRAPGSRHDAAPCWPPSHSPLGNEVSSFVHRTIPLLPSSTSGPGDSGKIEIRAAQSSTHTVRAAGLVQVEQKSLRDGNIAPTSPPGKRWDVEGLRSDLGLSLVPSPLLSFSVPSPPPTLPLAAGGKNKVHEELAYEHELRFFVALDVLNNA